MLNYRDWLDMTNEQLDEAALIVGGDGKRTKAYPKDGQIFVLAGGAGSGKGFVLNNVLLIDGKVFDVDAFKTKLLKYAPQKINDMFADEYGVYLENLKLTNPVDVSMLHDFVKKHGFADKEINNFFLSQASNKTKQNAVFDVTLKDIEKLKEISNYAEIGGYNKLNTHIVWVCNDLNVAIQQNSERDRKVAEKILFKTHEGAAMTMQEIIKKSDQYRKYADGEIWICFNKAKIDNHVSKNKQKSVKVDFYTAVRVKQRGKTAISVEELKKAILSSVKSKSSVIDTIEKYTGTNWV